MRVDLVYSQQHYCDHLLPIWNALPDELLGDVHRLGDMSVDRDRVALVAGGVDAHVLRDQCKAIYVEHGAGQTYGGASLAEAQNPSYSGAGSGRWPHVIGYVAPSDRVAARWAPAPAMAVGCPKMDQYMGRLNKPPGQAVCFAFHWDAAFCPEAQSTFQYWAPHMPQIIEAFNGQGFDVYGHAHPRWHGELDPPMRHQGLVVLGSDHDVFTRCDILFVDNSSIGPEFASLGRTVCWLNGPGYRRDVDHGMRFWDWAEMCPTFDGPRELVRLDLDALVAASDPRELALDAYKYVDGRSSQRAAVFVAELVRAL